MSSVELTWEVEPSVPFRDEHSNIPPSCLSCGKLLRKWQSHFCSERCERMWYTSRLIRPQKRIISALRAIGEVKAVRVMRCLKRRCHYVVVVHGMEPRTIDRVASAVSLYRRLSRGRWCFNVVFDDHIFCEWSRRP